MNILNKYYRWVLKSPGKVNVGFLSITMGLIMFINSQYGLKHVEANSGEKGISVFGDQLIYLMFLHVIVSLALSIIRIIRSDLKGSDESELIGRAFSVISVLIMPITTILIILYALVFI